MSVDVARLKRAIFFLIVGFLSILWVSSSAYAASACIDNDGDGYGNGCALGPDCNDNDPDIHPGATDTCGDGVDQDCDDNIDNSVPDASGAYYCFEVEPFNTIVGQPTSITLKAYHESGIHRIELVRDNDHQNKIVELCGNSTTCNVTTTVSQDYEGLTYFSFFLWKGPSAYVTRTDQPAEYVCPGEYCQPEPEVNGFLSWMREKEYNECITSKYLEFTLDPLGKHIMKSFWQTRPAGLASPFTVHFYDVVPTDSGTTYQSLGQGEGQDCEDEPEWPDWCPESQSADYTFVAAHFERTFGVDFNFVYHRLEIDYAETFGEPILVGETYYRFPNPRQLFLSQFPDKSIVHYALETYNDLPVQSITGGGFVVEINYEPYNSVGITIYSHEWGHTWGLPHPFYGSPTVHVALDGIMTPSTQFTPLIDPLDPMERYALEPASGYLDEASFAGNYSAGIIGSWQLPLCGTVDPAITSADIISEESDTITFQLELANNGDIPVGYVQLSALNGIQGSPIEERVLWNMSAGETIIHDFTINQSDITANQVVFVLDENNEIIEENENNNVITFSFVPQLLAPIGDKSAFAGYPLEFTVTVANGFTGNLSLSASGLPSGAGFVDNGDNTGTLTWIPTISQAGIDYSVTFEATDGTTSDSETITIAVDILDLLAPISNRTVYTGSTLQFTVYAASSFAGLLDDIYVVGSLPSGATFAYNLDNTGTFSWTPKSSQKGTYSITFVGTDGVTDDDESMTITVRKQSCFLAGTPILLSDGTTRAIEQLAVGDAVVAFDEKETEFKEASVTELFGHVEEEYLVINGHLKVTKNHPIYVAGEWVEAAALEVGDMLLGADGGAKVVSSIEEVRDTVSVYNIEVSPYHTYVAGGVVVHNKNRRPKKTNKVRHFVICPQSSLRCR